MSGMVSLEAPVPGDIFGTAWWPSLPCSKYIELCGRETLGHLHCRCPEHPGIAIVIPGSGLMSRLMGEGSARFHLPSQDKWQPVGMSTCSLG